VARNGIAPRATRCTIRAWRRLERLDGPGQTDIVFRFAEEPFLSPTGGHGFVDLSLPLLAGPGVFTTADPESPLHVSLAVADTSLAGVHFARLELTEMSQAPTIWISEMHGTLEVDTGAGSLHLRIEF
jgi:hypothetical protein